MEAIFLKETKETEEILLPDGVQKKKFDYKWVIIVCCFLMEMIALGFCSSTRSYFIGPVTTHLGIERSAYAINDTVRHLSSSVVTLFFGYLIGKFGARKLIGAGFICLIGSSLCYALAPNVWVIYLGGMLLGMGLAWTSTTIVGYVINKWSKHNKGTIMGAVLAANGVGGAIAMQIVSPIIERQSEIPGYKIAYFVIACVLFCFGTLIVCFFRNDPKNSSGNSVDEIPKKKSRGENWVGLEYSVLKKQWYYYVALICIFFTGFSLTAINGVAVQHMKDVGLDIVYVTNIWSIHSLFLAVFKFLTGFLYDKLGLRKTMLICSITTVLVMVSLASVTPTFEGKILAAIYSIFSGLALPLETIMLPIIAGDLFGQRSFAKVLGIISAVNTAGYALASPLMNLVYDRLGNYKFGLLGSGAVMVVVIIVMQFIITKANKEKKRIIAEEEKKTAEAAVI